MTDFLDLSKLQTTTSFTIQDIDLDVLRAVYGADLFDIKEDYIKMITNQTTTKFEKAPAWAHVGAKAVIVGNSADHRFEIGETVTIDRYDEDGDIWAVDAHGEDWCVGPADIAPAPKVGDRVRLKRSFAAHSMGEEGVLRERQHDSFYDFRFENENGGVSVHAREVEVIAPEFSVGDRVRMAKKVGIYEKGEEGVLEESSYAFDFILHGDRGRMFVDVDEIEKIEQAEPGIKAGDVVEIIKGHVVLGEERMPKWIGLRFRVATADPERRFVWLKADGEFNPRPDGYSGSEFMWATSDLRVVDESELKPGPTSEIAAGDVISEARFDELPIDSVVVRSSEGGFTVLHVGGVRN